MPPLRGNALPWNEGTRLDPDDKINIHNSFNNEVKKHLNFKGRLTFKSTEDEGLLSGRERTAAPVDQRSPASRA